MIILNRIIWLIAPSILGVIQLGLMAAQTKAETLSVSEDIHFVSNIIDNTVTSEKEVFNGSMSQINSVSSLRDVAPTDWAYEAFRSLVERYGCIVGYPDSTFRGNRALSRYEFAAALNTCMQQMERLIAESITILQQDVEILKRLAKEFETELAIFGGRIDNLESRVAFIEDHQFSTTTKLSALTSFYLSGAWSPSNIKAEGANVFNTFDPPRDENNNPRTRLIEDSPSITFSYLSWINLDTSFFGTDNLRVQFAAGNGNAPANQFLSAGYFNSSGTPFLLQTGTPNANSVVIRELHYTFAAADNIEVAVGPRILVYRYFDSNRYTFYLNGAESFNSSGSTQFSPIDRGSGAIVAWRINDIFKLTAGYIGNNTEFLPAIIGSSASNPSRGLFGGTYNITAELGISPTDNLNLRFLYNRSRLEPNPFSGYIGGAIGEPIPYGLADDGFGGTLRHAFANAYVFNFDWTVFDRVGLFGRYSWGSTSLTPRDNNRGKGHINSQSLQLGFAVLDLGKEGARATFSYVIPFSVVSGRKYLVSGGGNGGVQYEFEANYFYPVNDNIAIVPSFYVIVRPNNYTSNEPIYVTNLRTQFSF